CSEMVLRFEATRSLFGRSIARGCGFTTKLHPHMRYILWTKSIISRFRLQINHFFDRIGQYSSMSYIIYINEAVITCQFHKFQWRVPVCYGTLEVFREGEKCLYIQLF